ncbi:MAG: AbrB/MazE/SpoVT family DNA-binding domain-containing protein, partial [Proteobacteria bacterium]|nr:AbrB/MazE/SpoVT family DNA-binding domain-containing protein [Pseudomonadota bacterium]
MDQIATGFDTKSEKMRRLAAEGFKRAEIARYLDVRYQFVYNVLSAPGRRTKDKGGSAMAPARKERENPQMPSDGGMGASEHWVWTKLDKEGRIALPVAFREALGFREGD